MDFILGLHGGVRWLVALVAIGALVKFGMGWGRKMSFTATDRGIMSAFTGLLDLNLVLGLILLFGYSGVSVRARMEHATMMIVAVLIAHASAAWRKSDDAVKKFRNNFLVVLVAFILIISAVAQLRGGWVF